MSHYHPPPRRHPSHGSSSSRKRKDTEPPFWPPPPPPLPVDRKVMAPPSKPYERTPKSSSGLLAGYLAHEFLTKGTLLGQKFDPARAEAVPLIPSRSFKKPSPMGKEKAAEPNKKMVDANNNKSQSYVELANLLKVDGTHIPGIFNPTQLNKWIQN